MCLGTAPQCAHEEDSLTPVPRTLPGHCQGPERCDYCLGVSPTAMPGDRSGPPCLPLGTLGSRAPTPTPALESATPEGPKPQPKAGSAFIDGR